MKALISKLLFTLLLLFTSAQFAKAQSTNTVTYGAESYSHSEANPVFAPGTLTVTSLPWTVFFERVGSDGSVTQNPTIPPLVIYAEHHMNDSVTVTVNATTVTLTVAQMLAGMQAEFMAMRAQQIAGTLTP